MSKMILIAHIRYLNATRHGANVTFHYFVQKVIDAGKSFYIYDPVTTIKGCVVRVLKNNFGKLSEHYIN